MALTIKSPTLSLWYPEGQRFISFLIKKSCRSVIFPESNVISKNSFESKMRFPLCILQLVWKWFLMRIFKITEWYIKQHIFACIWLYQFILHTYIYEHCNTHTNPSHTHTHTGFPIATASHPVKQHKSLILVISIRSKIFKIFSPLFFHPITLGIPGGLCSLVCSLSTQN